MLTAQICQREAISEKVNVLNKKNKLLHSVVAMKNESFIYEIMNYEEGRINSC
jgi:hypothetical protein